MLPTKLCTKCKNDLSVDEFYACKKTRDGLQSWCKKCIISGNRQRQQENPEKTNRYQREYREKNAERTKKKAKERSRRHYLENKPAILSRINEYRANHPEVVKKSQARYCRDNREKRRQNTRRYYSEHPEKRREHASRRRARERKATVGTVDLEVIWVRDQGICHICGHPVLKKDVHYDHVIPLSRGGTHTMDNIKVSYSMCNIIKGTRLMEEINPNWFIGLHGDVESIGRERYVQVTLPFFDNL